MGSVVALCTTLMPTQMGDADPASRAHGPAEAPASTLEGHGAAATPALRISDQGFCQFVAQHTIGTMADPIDSAL